MIDALMANLEQARASKILQKQQLDSGGFVYVTLHRPSNVDEPEALRSIMAEIKRLAEDLPVVFPMHPRTRKMCQEFGLSVNDIQDLKIIEPIGYHDSLCLSENARLVLTDSGGLQEETTWFRTPCLTLRPNTERPVTVTIGSNRLTNLEQLRTDLEQMLNGPRRLGTIPPLWDGHAAERILAHLVGANSSGQREIAPCEPAGAALSV